MSTPCCDIIIPVHNRQEITKNCLDSIIKNTDSPSNIILVDNASDSPTQKYLDDLMRLHSSVTLVRSDANLGWVKAVNKGMSLSSSPYICVMNNDTVVKTPGWIRKLIGILQEGRAIGMISPLFETKKRPEYKGPFVETDYCRGHCFVVKREVVDKIGFLDEAFGFGYYDDVDYSLSAAKAGYHCVMANDVIVEHVRNSTFTSLLDQQRIFELQERNRRYLETKWGRRLRLVFIVDGNVDVPRIARLLFAVARQRHYIYIWNTGKPIELAHTNMVEKIFPGMLSKAIFQIMLALNRLKKPNKHYNKVFDLRWRFDEDDIEAEIKSMARV